MMLRRITLERYGCFGAAEFEFRRAEAAITFKGDASQHHQRHLFGKDLVHT